MFSVQVWLSPRGWVSVLETVDRAVAEHAARGLVSAGEAAHVAELVDYV